MQILNFLFGSAKVENTDLVLGEIALTLIVIVLAVIVPFVVKRMVKKPKYWVKLFRSFCKIAINAGILVLLALFLRYEGIYPFETRGWIVAILVGAIVVAVIVFRRWRASKPNEVVETMRYDSYERFLPKQKKK